MINYIVFVVVFVLEGLSWVIVVCEFFVLKGDIVWWFVICWLKDLLGFIVLFEDLVVFVGFVIVVIGVFVSYVFGDLWIDGVVLIVIGVILVVVVVLLVCELKGLLIGECVDFCIVEMICVIVVVYFVVVLVNYVCIIYIVFDSIFVVISVDFVDLISMGCGELMIEDMECELYVVVLKLLLIYICFEKCEDVVFVLY